MSHRIMSSHWIPHTAFIVWIFSTIHVMADTGAELDAKVIPGQMPNPVGASRVFPKTSFTCKNRPAGYYADVETGCQVYHMCDGVGRQFSYACPNTTLFQQRMLICDHWYMVNCSRAEDDYAANLLIGQRDKPFVPENEHQQRTPRPDLLDRPYAPDYSGESFRNSYKDLPPIQNHISETYYSKHLSKPLPTRWSLKNSLKPKEKTTTISNRRSDDSDDSDLGTSFSLRYNSSGDISSEHDTASHSHISTDSNTIIEQEPSTPAKVEAPSKFYEPPFLHPIYNENLADSLSMTTIPITSSTTSEAATATPTTEQITSTEFVSTPFTGRSKKLTNAISPSTEKTTITHKRASQEHESSNFVQHTSPITVKHQVTTAKSRKITAFERSGSSISPFEPRKKEKVAIGLPAEPITARIPTPPRDLLPPFQEYVVHDVATTQGPPIYYEWKTPSDSLEPPKLSVETGNEADSPSPTADASTAAPSFAHNPFLSALLRTKNSSPNDDSFFGQTGSAKVSTSSEKSRQPFRRLAPEFPSDEQIEEIQRELLIPDFLFPLENEGRTGYELDDTLDSFQFKIPKKRHVKRQIRRSRAASSHRQL